MKLQTMYWKYGNGIIEKGATKAFDFERYHISNADDRARKSKASAKERCFSYQGYKYFITLTVKGNSSMRYDGKALLTAAIKFIKNWNVKYFIQLEAYGTDVPEHSDVEHFDKPYFDSSSDRGKGFHIHALVSDYIDLSEWVNCYGGYVDNQYCEEIEHNPHVCMTYISKATKYTKSKLPKRTRLYASNVKKIAAKTECIISYDTVSNGLWIKRNRVIAHNVYDAIIGAREGLTSMPHKASVYAGLDSSKVRIPPYIVYDKEGLTFFMTFFDARRYRQAVHAPPRKLKAKARAPGKEKRRQGI